MARCQFRGDTDDAGDPREFVEGNLSTNGRGLPKAYLSRSARTFHSAYFSVLLLASEKKKSPNFGLKRDGGGGSSYFFVVFAVVSSLGVRE